MVRRILVILGIIATFCLGALISGFIAMDQCHTFVIPEDKYLVDRDGLQILIEEYIKVQGLLTSSEVSLGQVRTTNTELQESLSKSRIQLRACGCIKGVSPELIVLEFLENVCHW